jgi:hypothetical protein
VGIRRNTPRADGKVFWAYKHVKGEKIEVWITPEQFERRECTRRKCAKKQAQKRLEAQMRLPKEQRNRAGDYNPETGLYFIRYDNKGLPVWRAKEFLDKLRARNKISRKIYSQKGKLLPLPNVCVGDPHPETSGLYVKCIRDRRIFYGTMEEVEKIKSRLSKTYKKYKQKNKEKIKLKNASRREDIMKSLNSDLKRKRGDIDPITQNVFWGYSGRGDEVWLKKDMFLIKRAYCIKKRREQRARRKACHAE